MHVFLTDPYKSEKAALLRASLDALQPQKLGGFRTVSAQPQATAAAGLPAPRVQPRTNCTKAPTASASGGRGSASSPSRPHSRQRASPRWRAQRTAIFF